MCTATSKKRLPEWLKKPMPAGKTHDFKMRLRKRSLHTVCEEAKCPNLGECFARGTATIMIMGDVCTRGCGFCAIKDGAPALLDEKEPERVALQIKEMKLAHAVITSVTRDDLKDGGAAHFARTIGEIRKLCPKTTIEVLTPDFEGRDADIKKVCAALPDVFNHNVETVERLAPEVRNKANYRRSLNVLEMARHHLPTGLIKSGLMVGLGETFDEIRLTMRDLKRAGCQILTVGQYLRPSKLALPVKEYFEPKVFLEYEAYGRRLGFKHVLSGPFVRSSYMADKVLV